MCASYATRHVIVVITVMCVIIVTDAILVKDRVIPATLLVTQDVRIVILVNHPVLLDVRLVSVETVLLVRDRVSRVIHV